MELLYDEQNAVEVPGAIGLHIVTVAGNEIFRSGPVKYHAGHGLYYCEGGSWPEEIVAGVLMAEKEAV